MKALLLAALVVSAAASAGPIRLKSTEIGSGLDSTGHLSWERSTFDIGETITVLVFTEGTARNVNVTTRWVHLWTGKTVERNDVRDLNAQFNRIGSWFKPEAGDPSGAYYVKVFVNGKLLADVPFTLVRPPAEVQTQSQPSTSVAPRASSSDDSGGLVVVLALLMIGLIGAAWAVTRHSAEVPPAYRNGPSVTPNANAQEPPKAKPPPPSGPRKLELTEMLELRSKLLVHLNDGGTLPNFVAWMKAQSFVDVQVIQFGDWLEAYEAELEKEAAARKRAEAVAQSEDFLRAKAVLGWDGKPMTEGTFRSFRKAVFRKWHPDRRQVYVEMGWSSDDFDRASRQATEAVAFIEREFVAG